MDNKYRKLFSNSVIFAIGNVGSKMMNFIMVPLYTRYLTTADYGRSDIISTIVGLLTPLITLSVIDAVFRFSMESDRNRTAVLSNGVLISIVATILLVVTAPLLIHFRFALYITVLALLGAIQSMFQQFARGIGKSRLYALTGLVMTVITVSSNILLIVVINLGLIGYLTSLMIAQVVGIFFLIFSMKAWHYISLRSVNMHLMCEMLRYSIPIIPNSISWWISNSASKLFIAFFLGASANGIYAVANKIPTLISVFQQIFTQAWQISAVDEYKSKDASIFYSKILNVMDSVLIIGVSLITLFSQLIVKILSVPAYYSAWQIVPWLGLAVLYSSMSSFIGTVYSSFMDTSPLFKTTIIGGIINVVANLTLIPTLGISGAGIGSAFAFLVVTILRYYGSQKYIKMKIHIGSLVYSQILILIEIGVLHLVPGYIGLTISTILTIFIFIINRHPFTPIITLLISKINGELRH